MNFLTEPLSPDHPKSDFSCGKDLLDEYLHKQAGQDIKRKLAACFVLIDKKSKLIQGYYTLSNASIPLDQVPEAVRKKLPRSYRYLPATLLGRLATDTRFQGHGIGKILLIDALKRSYLASATIGSIAVVVDPLDEAAEAFYSKFGFIKLPDSGKMFLGMKTIGMLFENPN